MIRTNFLFDVLALYYTIEDLWDLDIDVDNSSIDQLFDNVKFKQTYLDYRNQFSTKQCVNELNDSIIVRYNDIEDKDCVINIVDVILDLLYNNEYLSLYQVLYIMKCINNKLNNIMFKNLLYNLSSNDERYLYDIIEHEIY